MGPALVLAAVLAAGFGLLLGGALRPLPLLALAGPFAALLLRLAAPVMRRAPAAPPWAVAAVLVVAAAFGGTAIATSSEHVVVRRDPAAYALTADWLARHGTLPIPAQREAFGGPRPGLGFAGPGSFPVGDAVVPQFMTGSPIALAAFGWVAGLGGVLAGTTVVSAAALLAVGGLAAWLAHPAWAPLAALALALTAPHLHTARSAYSEPLTQLLVLAALGLLALGPSRRAALLAGLAAGLIVLVRLEGLLEVGLLLVVAGLLARRHRGAAGALVGGLAAGAAVGLLDGVLLSRPYLAAHAPGLRVLAAGVVAAAVLGVVVTRWPRRVPSWAPAAAAVVPVAAAMFGYAVRPLLPPPRMAPGNAAAVVIAGIQARLGLPVDGRRTYAEQSLHWVGWYVGVAGLALAVAGLALLARRAVRDHDLALAPALVVLLGAGAVVLWRPEITPDHPWADRRLVPTVLPAVALGATAAAHALGRRRWWLGAVAVAALVGPAAAASAPLAGAATERGQPALLRRTCAALPPDPAVLLVGGRAGRELPLALRVRCEVPVAIARPGLDVPGVARAARAAGHRLVLVGMDPASVGAAAGAAPRLVARLDTREDDRTLVTRPRQTVPLRQQVWIGLPSPPAPHVDQRR